MFIQYWFGAKVTWSIFLTKIVIILVTVPRTFISCHLANNNGSFTTQWIHCSLNVASFPMQCYFLGCVKFVTIRHSLPPSAIRTLVHCFHLFTHRFLQQPPPPTDERVSSCIVFSRSCNSSARLILKTGNTTRSQPLSDGISIGYRSNARTSWFKLNVITRNCLVGQAPAYLNRALSINQPDPGEAQPTDWQHKSSSWSLSFRKERSGRRFSPSHHRNCGYLLPADIRLLYKDVPQRTTFQKETQWIHYTAAVHWIHLLRILCHQCDIYYYYLEEFICVTVIRYSRPV